MISRLQLVTLALAFAGACTSSTSSQRRDAPPTAAGAAEPAKDARPRVEKAQGPDIRSDALLVIDDSVPAEPDLLQKLVGPRTAVEAEMHEVVGESARPLRRGRGDSLLGNLVADVMRRHAAEVTGKPVDMAFTNLGGLRADLPGGPLTRGAILEVMPFDNGIVVFELTGADLAEVLNRSAQRGGEPISGVTYRIANKTAVDVMVGGQPLDPARIYRLCTNDYIIDGGGKFEALKRARNVNRTGVLIRDALTAYIVAETEAGRKVDAAHEGRIKGAAAGEGM